MAQLYPDYFSINTELDYVIATKIDCLLTLCRHYAKYSSVLIYLLLQEPNGVRYCYYSILQIRELRLREVKQLAQDHTASKWESWDNIYY